MVAQELNSSVAKSQCRMQIKFLMSGTVRLVPLKFNNAIKQSNICCALESHCGSWMTYLFRISMSIQIYTLVNYSKTDTDISSTIRIEQLRMGYFRPTRLLNDNFAFS